MHGVPFNKYSDKQFLKSQLRMHKITPKQLKKMQNFFLVNKPTFSLNQVTYTHTLLAHPQG